MLCNTRTDTNTSSTMVCPKRCKCLFNKHGSSSHLTGISQRYKTMRCSQHTCAGKSPSYSQSLRWDQCEAAIKTCPWQGRGCAGVSRQYSTRVSTYRPKSHQSRCLGPTRGMCCVPLPAQGKTEPVQTKTSSWKGKLLPPPGQHFTEKFAMPPSQGPS